MFYLFLTTILVDCKENYFIKAFFLNSGVSFFLLHLWNHLYRGKEKFTKKAFPFQCKHIRGRSICQFREIYLIFKYLSPTSGPSYISFFFKSGFWPQIHVWTLQNYFLHEIYCYERFHNKFQVPAKKGVSQSSLIKLNKFRETVSLTSPLLKKQFFFQSTSS